MIGSDYALSKGFLTIAQNSANTDYLRLAYAQALSIKYTQTHCKYAVMVTPHTNVPDKYKEVFDYVIDIPWGDDAKNEVWKLQNEWKTYHVTPFEQTLKLDCDMLFFDDLKPWWDVYDLYDTVPALNVQSYRGPVARSDHYRKVFTTNELPNLYSALFYYRKSEEALRFFKACEYVYKHWNEISLQYLDTNRTLKPTTDVAFALAAKLIALPLGCDIGRFVHMKSEMLGVKTTHLSDDWTKGIRHRFDSKMNLYVDAFKQTLPFHYQVKSFITDEVIAGYEKVLGI